MIVHRLVFITFRAVTGGSVRAHEWLAGPGS
jgi:hypothetical protein